MSKKTTILTIFCVFIAYIAILIAVAPFLISGIAHLVNVLNSQAWTSYSNYHIWFMSKYTWIFNAIAVVLFFIATIYLQFNAYGKNKILKGSSHFAGKNEIKQFFNITKLYKNQNCPANFVVGSKHKQNPKVTVTKEQHLLVLGQTGTGKTSQIIIPTIWNCAYSNEKPDLIIADLKGELFESQSRILEMHGYDVKVINFKNSGESMGWNPVNSSVNFETLVSFLFPSETNTKDPFWHQSASKILLAVLKFLRKYKANFVPKDVYNFCAEINNFELLADLEPTLKTEVNDFINSGAKATKGSTYSNLMVGISCFSNSNLNEIALKQNSINFQNPTALFIVFDIQSKQSKILASALMEELTNTLINRNSNVTTARKVLFLVDEFGNLPTQPSLANNISFTRSYKIFYLLVIQSLSQLQDKYGNNRANMISNNCTLLYQFTPDINTMSIIEKKCGFVEKEKLKKSKLGKEIKTQWVYSGKSSLVSINELQKFPKNTALILAPKCSPFKLKSLNFWKIKNKDYGKIDTSKCSKQSLEIEPYNNWYQSLIKRSTAEMIINQINLNAETFTNLDPNSTNSILVENDGKNSDQLINLKTLNSQV